MTDVLGSLRRFSSARKKQRKRKIRKRGRGACAAVRARRHRRATGVGALHFLLRATIVRTEKRVEGKRNAG
jgi:hypothetical protein